MNLGQVVQDTILEESEAIRISKLVSEDQFLKEILKRYGGEVLEEIIGSYRNNYKKDKLSKKQINKSIQNLENDIGTNALPTTRKKVSRLITNLPRMLTENSPRSGILKRFYQGCLTNYFIKEELELQQLLLEIEDDAENVKKEIESTSPAAYVFSMIRQHRVKYMVSNQTLERLYNYWWLNRLDECDCFWQEDDPVTVLMGEIKAIKDLIKNISESESEDRAPVENLEKLKAEDIVQNEEFLNLKNRVAAIEKLNEDVSLSELGDFTSKVPELESLEGQIKTKLDSNGVASIVNEKIKASEASDATKLKNAQRILRNELKTEQESFENETISGFNLKIDQINDRITAAFDQANRNFLDINSQITLLPKNDCKQQPLAQEEVFVNAWLHYLSDKYEKAMTLDEVMILHSIFKSLSYVILREEALCKSWVEALGVEEQTAVEIVNPLWVNRLDWLGLSSHLEDSRDNLKLSFVSNFNTAIVDAYLIPTLTKWHSTSSKNYQKMFLLPLVGGEDGLDYKNVYSVAGEVPLSGFSGASLESDLSSKDSFRPGKYMPKVKYKTFLSWIEEEGLSDFRSVLIDIPRERDGIIIPESAYLNFQSLMVNLMKYFSRKESLNISLKICIEPFVRSHYGEEISSNYSDFVKEFLQHG